MENEPKRQCYRVQLVSIGNWGRSQLFVDAVTPEDAVAYAHRYLAETGRAYLAVNAQLEENNG